MKINIHWRNLFGFLPIFLLYLWLVIQTAWVSDDAYITFRPLENFIHGYGPTHNIGERAQSFTHPLWFLVQSVANYLIGLWQDNPLGSSQLYYINILISLILSALTVIFFGFGIASNWKNAVLGVLALSLSKAFLDYSTSGLENPLSHLLIVLFLIVYLSEQKTDSRQFNLALLAALLGTNRIDLLLLPAPALLYLFLTSTEKTKVIKIFFIGFLPLIVWEIFSIIYYGFPFPNTAYAKLNTGISLADTMQQGIHYYMNSLWLDPITLLVIFAALVIYASKREMRQTTLVAGMTLYLLYILYIGGDFMSGRFFTPLFITAVSLLSKIEIKSNAKIAFAFALTLIVGIAPLFLIPERDPARIEEIINRKKFVDTNGIADERNFYFEEMGFINNLDGSPATYKEKWTYHNPQPVQVEIVGTLGVSGYRLGPNVHVIDRNALVDPLMARMPLEDVNQWRIGHFKHIIPEGYIETLASGENQIKDPDVAAYYEKLSIATKGEIWSWGRFVVIWNLNTGKYRVENQ